MNILVLSLVKKPSKDKTEYSSRKEVLPFLLERELKKAQKSIPAPQLIIIENAFAGSEEDFRSRFAFIINRAERKVQDIPNTHAKTDYKGIFNALKNKRKPTFHQPETVSYERKKTHVFPFDTDGGTGYVFSFGDSRVLALPDGVKADNPEELFEESDKIFARNAEDYPGGYSLHERELKVTTFFERHIPLKRDSNNEKIRKSVLLAATLVFIIAAYMFIDFLFLAPLQNAAIQSEIQTIAYQQEDGAVAVNQKNPKLNWKGLLRTNNETKGWVRVNDTQINYPIVQHKGDNKDYQFYLHHNFKKEPSSYGAIFIDYRSKKGMKSKNVVIHGHSMDDASMFGDLLKYGRTSADMSFYKKAPVVKINTPKGGAQTYKIISVFKTNVYTHQGEYFDFYAGSFKSKAQFMNYVYNLRIRSLINCPVNVNERDRLITLVTCSYEFQSFRTVVVARKCRKNESTSVDVKAASPNGSAVWPQCYYSRYGGTRPTISTFKKALKKGKIKWYDGNRKLLKGSEQLPTTYTVPTQPTTSTEATTTKPTEKPTEKRIDPKKQKYTVKITARGKYLVNRKVKYNSKVNLPTPKTFKKGGYIYTFKKWRAKGFGKRKYLVNIKYVVVRGNIKLKAVYKKSKIPKPKPTKPKATKPVKKPAKPTKSVVKSTPKPTEAPKATEAEEDQE
ncbi:MAG: class B sortase [Ruminococcus sp.]|nr:class B sortase [Ruminococcus sp.]